MQTVTVGNARMDSLELAQASKFVSIPAILKMFAYLIVGYLLRAMYLEINHKL